MNLDEWERLLVTVCNEGPYTIDLSQCNQYVQVWKCEACEAILRFGNNASIPAPWTHYKPRHKPVLVPEAFYKAFEEDVK